MRTIGEEIEIARTKKEQSENELKVLLNRKRDTERRERTHRLIERGAILESLVDGLDDLTNEQVQDLLIVALETEQARQHLRGLGVPL